MLNSTYIIILILFYLHRSKCARKINPFCKSMILITTNSLNLLNQKKTKQFVRHFNASNYEKLFC